MACGMSRPLRTAAARTHTYRAASDSDDPMQNDDELPLSQQFARSRSSTANRSGVGTGVQSRWQQPRTAPQLNDEIDDDEEYGDWRNGQPAPRTAHNNRLPVEADRGEEVLVLEDDEQEEEEEHKEQRDSSARWRSSKPQHRPRRSSARSPPIRQRRPDPLEEEVEAEEEDGDDGEFDHEKALLSRRYPRTANNRSSPSPSFRAERVLSSGIELRRRRSDVDYRRTKIDRQSFYTPDAWKKADKLHNGAAGSTEKGGRGTERRKKQLDDDLFEPDVNEEDEDEEEADEEAEDEEVAEDDEDDVLNFSHLQRVNRRSERTLGKKVDYSNHALDEAIRSAQLSDWNKSKQKRNNTAVTRVNGKRGRKCDTEQMDEADERQNGDEDEVQPMTDSDAEGYEGRRGRKQREEGIVAEENESDLDTASRLQAEQYTKDGYIPGKLLAMRREADCSTATNLPTHPAATASSSSSSSSPSSSPSFEYLVKWKDRAYKHSTWLHERVLLFFPFHVNSQMTRLRNSLTKAGVDINSLSAHPAEQSSEQEDGSVLELEDNQFYNPDFNQVHRIVSHRKQDGMYLVKWKGLGYDELTWETTADIDNDAEIERYHRYSRLPSNASPTIPRPLPQPKVRAKVDELKFENERELREYQKEGVSWMCFNWLQGLRPSLLADEMGLGKTAQVIAVCRFMQQYYNVRGPFLIVAPLSTVGHWQREFETWTDMNAVIFHGTQEARDAIREYEFHMFEFDGRPRKHRSLFRFNALIVPDSIVRNEKSLLCSSQHNTQITAGPGRQRGAAVIHSLAGV